MVTVLDGTVLRLRRNETRRIVDRTRSRRGTHNERRPFVVRSVVEHLRVQYRRAMGAAAPDDPEWDRDLDARIRRIPDVQAALERMWPVLTGADLVHDLFSFTALVRSASDGLLTREEQDLLHRPRSKDVREVRWTEADLALIDEADALLGPPEAARPRRRRARRRAADDAASRVVAELGVGGFVSGAEIAARYAGNNGASAAEEADEPRTFGHVLVDEAQDLSPMQWRMLARRCPSGSMTLVGDFGQASRAGAPSGWDEVLANVPGHAGARVVELSVNYRTPAEIMAVADRVLAAAAPGVPAARAVRATGRAPRFEPVAADDLVRAAAAAARRATAREGTVAVIAPAALHEQLVTELADVGAVADTADALDAPVTVLGATDAKGLEFDEVIVVEPADLVRPDPSGLRLLYVTLTRATQRLLVVHAQPLPEALAPDDEVDVQRAVGSRT
jgi:hypothetical protein